VNRINQGDSVSQDKKLSDRSNQQTIRYVYMVEEGMGLTEQQQDVAKERVKEMIRRQIAGATAIYATPQFYPTTPVAGGWVTTALNELPQCRGKAVVLNSESVKQNADHYQLIGISVGKDPQIKNHLKLASSLGNPAIAYNPATNKLVNLQPSTLVALVPLSEET
jgi:hypothetical protein